MVLYTWAKLQCRISCCRASHETSCPLLLDVEAQRRGGGPGKEGEREADCAASLLSAVATAATSGLLSQTFNKADWTN